MGLDNLLYYILDLIVEGHKWQYQNATCTNTSPKLYYTTLQWVAIGLASIFVLTKTSGLNNDIVDYLLSSLSIMTGFFLALVVVVYEKYMRLEFNATTDDEKITDIKTWNYLRQFNALTSYAILISIVVISILVGSLLFGHETKFSDYRFATSLQEIDVLLSIRLSTIVIVRFLLIYFLLDFFILTIYAISSLFQFVNLRMSENQPQYGLNLSKVTTDKQTLKKAYPRLSVIAKCIIGIAIAGLIIYELDIFIHLFNKVIQLF